MAQTSFRAKNTQYVDRHERNCASSVMVMCRERRVGVVASHNLYAVGVGNASNGGCLSLELVLVPLGMFMILWLVVGNHFTENVHCISDVAACGVRNSEDYSINQVLDSADHKLGGERRARSERCIPDFSTQHQSSVDVSHLSLPGHDPLLLNRPRYSPRGHPCPQFPIACLPFLNHVLLFHRPPHDARGRSAESIPEQGTIKPSDGVTPVWLNPPRTSGVRPGACPPPPPACRGKRSSTRKLGRRDVETDVGVDHRINGLAQQQ